MSTFTDTTETFTFAMYHFKGTKLKKPTVHLLLSTKQLVTGW